MVSMTFQDLARQSYNFGTNFLPECINGLKFAYAS